MRGISPIVAVVLLLAMAVISGVGVYFWVNMFTSKPATPNTPGMVTVHSVGPGKLLIANIGAGNVNLSALKTSDPNVNITCEKESLGSGEQVLCSVYGHVSENELQIYGEDIGTVALAVSNENETVKPWSPSLGQWHYRQEIDIGSANGSQTDYQVKIVLNASNVGSHFNWSSQALKFTELKDGQEVEIPYWIEYWNATEEEAIIWVKADVPGTVYMYYGNENATSESDASSVFIDDIPGLVGFWDFDEGQGNVVHDRSGYGNDGEIKGMYSLSFDGDGDYLTYNNDNLKLTGNLTVAIWLKADNWTHWEQPIFNGMYEIKHRGDWAGDKLYFLYRIDNNSAAPCNSAWSGWAGLHTSEALQQGKWYLFVGEKEGDTLRVYLNGVKKNEGDCLSGCAPHDPNSITSSFKVGGNGFNGSIAEIRIYNRTLNDTEIETLYSLGPGTNYATDGLVLWLDFSNKEIDDSSGNNNAGTMNGDPTWVVDGPYSGWVNGKFGHALRFDGINDYLLAPHNDILNTNESTSVLFWIKKNGHYTAIMGKVNSYYLRTNADDKLFWTLRPIGGGSSIYVSSLSTVPLETEWVHVTAEFYKLNETHYQAYTVTNAQQTYEVNKTFYGNVSSSTGGILVGKVPWSPYYWFNGSLDEVSIVNRSISLEDNLKIYNNYAFATPNYKGHLLIRKGYELPGVAIKEEEKL